MSDTLTENAAPAITLTPAAIERVNFLMAKQGKPNLSLRLGVKGGGCSGLSYSLGLEEMPTERDHILAIGGLTVLVDRKSARFLEGMELDYTTKNLLEGGWKFSNPNAQRSCGCGTSFTPK